MAIVWRVWTTTDHQALGPDAAGWKTTPKAALRRETAASMSVLLADL
nr:hypothetical protein [Synechococcus sp. AH-551-C10]